MKRSIMFILLVSILASWTSACSARSSQPDLKLAPLSALPQKMQDAPTQVREAYQFALANQDILKYIPCYCGCGKEGHKA